MTIQPEEAVSIGEFSTDVFWPGLEDRNMNLAIGFLPEMTGVGEFSKHLETIAAVNEPLAPKEHLDNWVLISSRSTKIG